MELDINKTWKSVLDSMRLSVSEATFNAYVKKTELLNIKQVENRLVGEVGCSSGYITYRGNYDIHGTALDYMQSNCTLFIKFENPPKNTPFPVP